MTALELREKRAPIAAQIKAMADKANAADGKWQGEDEQTWTRMNADYDALTRQIEIAERAEKIDGEQREVIGASQVGRENTPAAKSSITAEDRSMALQAWALSTSKRGLQLSDAHRKAAEKCGVNLTANEFEVRLDKRTTIGSMTTTLTDGGDTIPVGFVPNFERALLAFGGVRQAATILRTDTGNTLYWPTTNDTGNSGALLAEVTEDSDQDVTTSRIQLDAYKYTSKIVKLSGELLQDSAFDLASTIGSMCGERIGRATAAAFTTGTGSSQPKGIVTAATTGVTTASATAITANELVELIHSIDPAYRTQGCAFMLHDSILLAIRKLKDDYGQYIWQPGIRDGQPDALFGFPYHINQSMASSIVASAKTVLFGNLKKFLVRDVAGMTLKRLPERYAEFDVEAFVALSRHDSELLDAGTHPVKLLVQKSS